MGQPCCMQYIPSKHRDLNMCWLNVGPRLRRWPGLTPALVQHLISAGIVTSDVMTLQELHLKVKINVKGLKK